MKIATYNVNGIGARLPALIRWLAESKPDVACLQELKAPQEKFPEPAIREAGLEPNGEEREFTTYWEGFDSPNNIILIQVGVKDKAK